jgi:hypothetical protein
MQIQGKIIKIYDTIQVSEKFKKRDIVIETNEQYPQKITVQFTQDRCAIIDNYNVSQAVTVSINIRGVEYPDKATGEAKYFNTIQGWKIESEKKEVPAPTPSAPQPSAASEDDLPF